jgi:transcriptional regulator with XRE-family HTH domain
MILQFDRNEFQRVFGRRLAACRIAKNLSQDQLAAVSGYHKQTISNLERGLTCPSLVAVFLFAEVLKVSPQMLLFGTE